MDAPGDRRAGIRTYAAARGDASRLLIGMLSCELVLLAGALALTWPRSVPAAIALALWVPGAVVLRRSRPLRLRLARYEDAPLAGYYFFAFPVAVALSRPLESPEAAATAAVLLVLAVPHAAATLAEWRRSPAAEPGGVQRA
jgi:hypothetical protein